MDELVFRVQRRPQLRRPADELAGGVVGHVAEVLLRLDDRIEIATIGHVDDDLAEPLDLGGQPFRIEEARHIGQADLLDEAALLAIADVDFAGRRIDREPARLARRDQPVLDAHGDRADRAMAAHRQAARGLDEQHGDVAIRPRRRIEDRARHHVVPTRLEHQPGADPVELAQEMRPLLQHGRAVEARAAARDEADRIAAGMAVDAGEGVAGHRSKPS